ncbi:unnamed protein product [Anisakis simplex]|uniref:Protein kinase domain-containing protein n=1 Tax=Anisakis simplex TaxID=6269 RepID=A0A0M3KIK5_ANISI|nr:unnamed protein product [Anisakis simplex]
MLLVDGCLIDFVSYETHELFVSLIVGPWLTKVDDELNHSLTHFRFTTLRLLGKGGFGAVYEVKRQLDGQVFAMKCELIDVRKRVSYCRIEH